VQNLSADFKDWRWVIAYVLFIYISLPFVPIFWTRVIAPWGGFAKLFPFILLSLVFLVTVYYLAFVLRKPKVVSYVLILISFFISILVIKNLKLPAERIHLIEYGILPFFIYRPLSHKTKLQIYTSIFIIGFVVGVFDEFIQYIIPNRFFDLRDILMNATGVILGEVVLYSFKKT